MAVNNDPVSASHMSGAELSRSPSAERSANTARTAPVATTTASQARARTHGGRSLRTGVRLVARSLIRRSFAEPVLEDVFMALFPGLHSVAKRLQRAMQI